MSDIVVLKPHEWGKADFYLDVYLRPVREGPAELLKGAFGIALAQAMFEEGMTGKVRVIHTLSSEIIRVTPEGPKIFARSLRDRTLSGEVLWFGYKSGGYSILGLSRVRDRRFPIKPLDGPQLLDVLKGLDPLGLKDSVMERLRAFVDYHGIDMIVGPRELADMFGTMRMSVEEAEKLVYDLASEILNELQDAV